MIEFEEIDKKSEVHKKLTYEILSKRVHNISHIKNVSFNEHQTFVNNHPYRIWYLIKHKVKYIGTTYISDNNTIGINLLNYNDKILTTILNFILSSYKPLPPIESIRSENFLININPENQSFIRFLESYGAIHIQNTYKLS